MLNKLKYEVFGKKRDYEIVSEPGERMRQTWREKIDEQGNKFLVEDELYDQFEEIQSYADSVDVNKIIQRYMSGDESALDRARAFYADVTKVPKNFAQMVELNSRAEMAFKQLPTELQELYGYSYVEFLNNPEVLEEFINNKNHVYVNDEVNVDESVEEKPAD